MNSPALSKLTGFLFIFGAVVVNIPYALLIANFEYPDILRQPPEEILNAFAQGGSGLIYTWLAFAWAGLPILIAILLLPKALGRADDPFLRAATALGVIGAITQMIGLLRWVFVIPGLAQAFIDPQTSAVAREALGFTFQIVHQFGGVLLGEHIGQAFTIFWMSLVSIVILRTQLFKRWVGWLGLTASVVNLLAQGELLSTVIPGFPQAGLAGLVGSLLWLVWMVVLGLFLLRVKESEPVRAGSLAVQ